MSRRKKRKKPTHIKIPTQKKIPRGADKARKIGEEHISWHLGILDKDGDWTWRGIDEKTIWKEIHSKLSEFERKTWNEILIKEKYRNHKVSVSDICSEAQKRLAKIKQDDTDDLISLRLSGEKRVWGIRLGSILKILWWDPHHTVCPSIRRHT